MAVRNRTGTCLPTTSNTVSNVVNGQAQALRFSKRHALGEIQNKIHPPLQQGAALSKKASSNIEPICKPAPAVVRVSVPPRVETRQNSLKNVVSKVPKSTVPVAAHVPITAVAKKGDTAKAAAKEVVLQPAKPVVDSIPPTVGVCRKSEPECVPMETSQHEAYSANLLCVPNIDDGDEDNPLLVSEYVNDIYDYLRNLEVSQGVASDYLAGRKTTPRMRAILVDWLAQVHSRFNLLPETFYMTVAVLDRYLQAAECSKDKLQLLGVAAMFLSSKYEEIYAPEVGDFVYITDNSYTKKDILQMEMQILRVLDFNLGRPLPIHFLRRFSKAADADGRRHSLAKYLMELCMVDYAMCSVPPSKVAAAALFISLYLLDEGFSWNQTLVFYTKYEQEELQPTVLKVANIVLNAQSPNAKQTAIRKKYETTKFLEVSKLQCLVGAKILKLTKAA